MLRANSYYFKDDFDYGFLKILQVMPNSATGIFYGICLKSQLRNYGLKVIDPLDETRRHVLCAIDESPKIIWTRLHTFREIYLDDFKKFFQWHWAA